MTALDAATLASLGWAPASPDSVTIRGVCSGNSTFHVVTRMMPMTAAACSATDTGSDS